MTEISVVIATYNGARFIGEQLRSLAEQTEPPCELVVSDDGSTDRTVEILEDFSRAAPFSVRIHQNATQKGYRANFMDAAALCQADVIAFCDQDDVWRPDKLRAVKPWFDDGDVTMVFHNARIVDQQGEFTHRRVWDDHAFPLVNPPATVQPWVNAKGFTQSFRSSLLKFRELRDGSLDFNMKVGNSGHDEWMFFLASSLGKMIYLSQELVDYRQHDTNLFGLRQAVPAVLSPFEMLRQKLQDGAEPDRRMADVLRDRASVLRRFVDDESSSASFREHARVAAARHSRLAEWLERRADIYRGKSLAARCSAWSALVRSAAYGGSAWAFTKKSALRDAVGAVVGPRPRDAARAARHET